MKNKIFVLGLSLILISSCGGETSDTKPSSESALNPSVTSELPSEVTSEGTSEIISISESSETPSVEPSVIDYNLTFSVKNIIDGYISDAKFYLDGNEINPILSNNVYSLKLEEGNYNKLKIVSQNYLEKEILLKNNYNLGDISLEKDFVMFGSTRFNSNDESNMWNIGTTRGLENIRFKFHSDYNRFKNSESAIGLYINTGKTSTSLASGDYLFNLTASDFFVYDYGFVHNEVNKDLFNYSIVITDNKTDVYFDIPYSYLKMESDDIIGVNVIDNVRDADIKNPLYFNEKMIDINKTRDYIRIDGTSDFFENRSNEANPGWISKAKFNELTKGKPFNFGNPEYVRFPEGDNVYFSLEYTTEGLNFDFVGFGTFEDEEFFKIILHNNIIDKNSWGLCDDDIVVNIHKNEAQLYTNCSNFFDVEKKGLTPYKKIKTTGFVEFKNYFTLKLSIPLTNIKCVKTAYDDIYINAVEFKGIQIYDGINYAQNFFMNGVACGDPADMVSYRKILAPLKKSCNLTAKKRIEYIGNRDISFANPEDTSFAQADDFYMSMSKGADGVSYDIVGFGDFCETEIITFVFHMSNTDGDNWKIQESDVTLMISQKKSVITSNTTDFWFGTRISRSETVVKNRGIYTRFEEEGFFTIKGKILYSELGDSVTQTSKIRMYAFEFGFCGELYNSEPWTNLMRKNGVACGDPAFQKNYLTI